MDDTMPQPAALRQSGARPAGIFAPGTRPAPLREWDAKARDELAAALAAWASSGGKIVRGDRVCLRCETRTRSVLVRLTAANGATHAMWRCETCGRNTAGTPDKQVPFVGRTELLRWRVVVEDLPPVTDYRSTEHPCVVCGRTETELHHFAPRAVFDTEADNWPTAWLCSGPDGCHARWHKLVTPNMRRAKAESVMA